MKNVWSKAKENKEILHFKNFQKPEITWEDALTFVYNLSKIQDERVKDRAIRQNDVAFGSVMLTDSGYFWFEENNLFPIFKGVEELMEKVNGGSSGKDCIHYLRQAGHCSCNQQWHIQTLRFVMGHHIVSSHTDPNDVLYWQLLGTSYWKMNNGKEYKLEPGDLFYFNKDDSHQVWQDGPRAGIIIDDIKQRKETEIAYRL
jgi:mannose-6-phosphate isomerase-like protein (cupin superfamily)